MQRFITAKMTPLALRLVRLIAAATGETQFRVLERLLGTEAERLKLKDAKER